MTAPGARRTTLAAILMLAATGCGEVVTKYGDRSGYRGDKSVNGTAVLGRMFQQAGHRVGSWPRLSPALEDRDVIVWFPTDLAEPSAAARDWLEEWLEAEDGRTLIYVGRDFDAAPGYLKRMQAAAPPEQKSQLAQLETEAALDFGAVRSTVPQTEDWGWFTIDSTLPARKATALDGALGWVEGIDASRANIELNSRLLPPDDFTEVLLSSQSDALVTRRQVDESQLIVVANASFLLNVPLINHEHRKLAARLIDEIGENKRVVFLETDSNPTILDQEPQASFPTGLEMLGIEPFNVILLHWALVGVIFCFARFPIFGRAQEPTSDKTSDFGEHVAAVGTLLALSGDRAYAQQAIEHYRRVGEPQRDSSSKFKKPIPRSATDVDAANTGPPSSS